MRTFAAAIVLLLSLPGNAAFAQRAGDAPFAELDRRVKAEQGGWMGDRDRLSGYFNDERKRLGSRFEPELMKYIRGDVEKHYWISFFLEDSSYLHGNTPLPQLALLVKEEGLSLARKGADEDSRGYVIGLSVTAAVLAQQLGLTELAAAHKGEAERLLATIEDAGVYFPAISDEERRLYRSIGSGEAGGASPPGEDEDASEPKAQIQGGQLDGKAISKPAPVYPTETNTRAAGEVVVRVVVDESGKVMWAKAISGHPLLQASAVAAAYKAVFRPTLLSGKPARAVGFLTYEFRP
jgi:TonB family protein